MRDAQELGAFMEDGALFSWDPEAAQLAASLSMQPAGWGGEEDDSRGPKGCPGGASGQPHKARLRWTPELHTRFLASANALGGPEVATPKQIMVQMEVPGLTLLHVKSHLQKYRTAIKGAGSAKRARADGERGPCNASKREEGTAQGIEFCSSDSGDSNNGEEEWEGIAATGAQVQLLRCPMDCAGSPGCARSSEPLASAAHAELPQQQQQQRQETSSPDAGARWALHSASPQPQSREAAGVRSSGAQQALPGQSLMAEGQPPPTLQALQSTGIQEDGLVETLGAQALSNPIPPCGSAPSTTVQLAAPAAPAPGLQSTQSQAGLTPVRQRMQQREVERAAGIVGAATAGSAPAATAPSREAGEGRRAYMGCLERALAAQVEMQLELQGALEAQRQLQERLLMQGQFVQRLIRGSPGAPTASSAPAAKLAAPDRGFPRGCTSPAHVPTLPRGSRKAHAAMQGRRGKRSKSQQPSATDGSSLLEAAMSIPVLFQAPPVTDVAAWLPFEAPGLAAVPAAGGDPRLAGQETAPAATLAAPAPGLQWVQQQLELVQFGGAWPAARGLATGVPGGPQCPQEGPAQAAAPTAQQQQQWAMGEAGCSAGFRIDPGEVLARLTRGLPIHRLELAALLGPASPLTRPQRERLLQAAQQQQQRRQMLLQGSPAAAALPGASAPGSLEAPFQGQAPGQLLPLPGCGSRQTQQCSSHQPASTMAAHYATCFAGWSGESLPADSGASLGEASLGLPGGVSGAEDDAPWAQEPQDCELFDVPGSLEELLSGTGDFL